MIFHIAGAAGILGIHRIAEKFRNDGAERLAEDVVKNVQPATVRHADHKLANAKLRAAFQNLLDGRDHRLAAIDAETLGAGIFLVKIFLEFLSIDKALIDRLLAPLGKIGAVADRLDAFLDPGLLRRGLDVHEFDADGARIGLAKRIDNLAKRRRLQPKDIIDKNRAVPVGLGKAVGGRVELRMEWFGLERQRVELGKKMATDAVGADQHDSAERVERSRPHVIGVHMPAGGMSGGHGVDGIRRIDGPDNAASVARPAWSLINFDAAFAKRV